MTALSSDNLGFPDDFPAEFREIIVKWRNLRDVSQKIRRDTLINREPSLPLSIDGIIATANAFDELLTIARPERRKPAVRNKTTRIASQKALGHTQPRAQRTSKKVQKRPARPVHRDFGPDWLWHRLAAHHAEIEAIVTGALSALNQGHPRSTDERFSPNQAAVGAA